MDGPRRAPEARAPARPAWRERGSLARLAWCERGSLARLAWRERGSLARLAWRERVLRARLALLAGLAVAVLLGTGAVLGSIGHPARTAARPATAAIPGSGTRAARWLAGPAGKLLSAVSADLGRLTVAGRGTDPGPARLAGLRLSADARAALLGPAPPLAARLYRSALTELERAGRSAAQGRMRAAAVGLRAGESTITKVTALANSPAAGVPVPEPAG